MDLDKALVAAGWAALLAAGLLTVCQLPLLYFCAPVVGLYL